MPDLNLLDIMMPQMDGLEVLTRLKEDPSMPFIPVILLSAQVLDEDLQRGYKMGAEYYITKPFTPTQVLDGINLVLVGDQGDSVEARKALYYVLSPLALAVYHPAQLYRAA